MARVRAESQALGHAGPEALDQDVGPLDELEHDLDGAGVLEVERNGWTAAAEHVLGGRHHQTGTTRSIDADDVGTEVGQQHAGERAGTDSDELDDAYALQRAGAWVGHSLDCDSGTVTVASDPRYIPTVWVCVIIGVTFGKGTA